MKTTPVDTSQFTSIPDTNKEDDETTKHNNNTKKQRSNSGYANSPPDIELNDYAPLELPAFDLSSSIVSYSIWKLRVKTIEFEVNFYLTRANILNTLLTRSSLRSDPENYDSIRFLPYGLAQLLNEEVYTQQSVK